MLRNAMTVDVEDYFQVSAFERHISRESWDSMPCRIERNMDRVLSMLDAAHTKATFFTLGWIAKRYPGVVRRIVENGHELASHGSDHYRITDQTPERFRNDVVSAKKLLEDLGGLEVIGYRAPSFSIGEKNLWALDVLAETGHVYSSSIYPIHHDHYGMPLAPRFRYRPRGPSGILEIPATTVSVLGRNLPASGGGYFRLLPYAASRFLVNRVNRSDLEPTVFYFHPWEIDPSQPRQSGVGAKTRFRHYVNLSRMEGKIVSLLKSFEWGRMDEVFLGRAQAFLPTRNTGSAQRVAA
jgi:polysaccharide deacetylase family protein (PEP-CTERM system associated)